jgi:predicted ATPase
MISRVVIKNFKSIGEAAVDLELKPLTLLVGPNGGGKSSILEAIAVASQGGFSGRLTNFPSWDSVVHKSPSVTGAVEVYFGACEGDHSIGVRQVFGARTSYELLANGSVIEEPEEPELRRAIHAAAERQRSNTFLISSVRGDFPYVVHSGEQTPSWVGVHGQSLILLLNVLLGQRRYGKPADKITRWAARFGMHGLKAGYRAPVQAGSDYLDSHLEASVETALASSGARQILPVITQLFWAPEGSLLMVEEPEISLHPKAQIDVLEMFAEAIREDNKQIIATTHSHILLQALGYAVHKRWIKSQDIAVYHVEKSSRGTRSKRLPLRSTGYIRGWIPSFSKVERELLSEWAKTLPRK